MTYTRTAPWPSLEGTPAPPGPRAAPGPDAGGTTAAVSLHEVTMAFRGAARPSVSRLSLAFAPGQVFGLLGPNGSGKTTTINLITGLMIPASGTVRVFGLAPRHARRLMGVVTQETALLGPLPVEYNLRYHGKLHGFRGRDLDYRVGEALELANLAGVARSRAATLSGGMQRRLAIARALLPGPDLVILDEPTLGVDPGERLSLWQHIRGLADSGTTVLLTTNIMEEAQALCDRVAIMRAGQLAAGPDAPAALQRRYGGTSVTVQVLAMRDAVAAALEEIRAVPGVTSAESAAGQDGEYRVTVAGTAQDGIAGQVVTALTARGARIGDVATRGSTLDEVFLRLTGSAR